MQYSLTSKLELSLIRLVKSLEQRIRIELFFDKTKLEELQDFAQRFAADWNFGSSP